LNNAGTGTPLRVLSFSLRQQPRHVVVYSNSIVQVSAAGLGDTDVSSDGFVNRWMAHADVTNSPHDGHRHRR